MSKKQGVKKGGQQAADYATELICKAAMHDSEMRFFGRAWMMDMVTITLGRMGFREKRFRALDKLLEEVCDEYGQDSVTDLKGDEDIWYTKAALDREIGSYVGKMFVPWEKRYGFKPTKPRPFTHAVDIRTMPVKDLARFLSMWKPIGTEEQILEWLKMEVKEDG